jgi:hypothetical protein
MFRAYSVLSMCVIACALSATASSVQAQDRPTMIRQSYDESFGRQPSQGEIDYWNGRQDWSTKDQLINFHMQGLKTNAGLQSEAVRAAYAQAGLNVPGDAMLQYWMADVGRYPRVVRVLSNDIKAYTARRAKMIDDAYTAAFGQWATQDEMNYGQTRPDWAGVGQLTELHRNYIRGNEQAADRVVTNSYLNVFKRQPNDGERGFWRPHVMSGLLCSEVEAAHRDWYNRELRRVASDAQFVAAIANAGLAIDVHGNLVRREGVQLVGNSIVAAGAGNIVAAGGGNIVAAGGGNLVAKAGTYLIGQDGASLIGHDGATLVRRQ